VQFWTTLGERLPGARARAIQVAEFAAAWERANADALAADGPLWIALGDSSAQAIGASAHDRGYVGQILERLRVERDPSWRVVNLSRTGALTADVLAEQLPRLAELPEAQLVTCAVGGNDVIRRRQRDAVVALTRIAAALPRGSVIATMPRGLLDHRARPLTTVVRTEAARHGHRVADLWATTGRPWRGKFSADWFHPNDRGYEDWTAAFAATLDL
jgi:lysophospholipase L1-like esterase